jgi:polar amino acid transport system substrate-binding protein
VILEARDLTKSFLKQKVLDGFAVKIKKGELVTLIGPSGCGKSTVLRCLNGLEDFDEGGIRYEIAAASLELRSSHEVGKRSFDDAAQLIRKKVGMVFQSFNLFPHLNLLENMLLAPRVVLGMKPGTREGEETRSQALTLLGKVGLDSKTQRRPHELSGGEQQRAAIARAMLLKPEILLYDEPTSALDPGLVQEVLGVMKDLKSEGLTQLVVTHEMRFAREASDRVLFMNEGKVVEDGPPDQIFLSPQRAETRSYLSTFTKFLSVLFVGVATFSAVLFSQPAFASSMELRWAADAESGAPFVFRDPSDPEKLIGFEVELVEALANRLGKKPIFVQNNWDGLIEGLRRGEYDLVINGIEITEERSRNVLFSNPYFVTSQVLTTRESETGIEKLEDVSGKRVGTLAGSLASRMLSALEFPLEVVSYSDEIHAYNDLSFGRLDAVFLDQPIALYYATPNLRLKHVAETYGQIKYGIALRPDSARLAAEIDRALNELKKDGVLSDIYQRWGLWNKETAGFWRLPYSIFPLKDAVAYQRFQKAVEEKRGWKQHVERYASYLPFLARGALTTLKISVASMVVAIAAGLVAVLARLYGGPLLRAATTIYIELFRGTPLLIQLFLLFYGLPHLGIRLDPFWAAVIGLGLNYGACEAENYRAGILSVPKAQLESARALGLSQWQSLRYVVFPQAIRIALPPSTNDFIALLKDSSLVSVITMVELTSVYGQLASANFDYLGIGVMTAVVYLLIGLPFVKLSRRWDGANYLRA